MNYLTEVTKYPRTWNLSSLSYPDHNAMVLDNFFETNSNYGSEMIIKDRDSKDIRIEFVATPET